MRDKIFIIDKTDSRNTFLKRQLESEGYMALDYGENTYEFMGSVIYVFSPARLIDLDVAKRIRSGSYVFALKLDAFVQEEFTMRNIKYINILDDEIFAHKNALLTAEGALALVMQETEYSLFSARVLVLGYGRIGKSLCKLFRGAGASVTPVTTTYTEEILAGVYLDDSYLTLDTYAENIGCYNVIINTVPLKIMSEEILKKVNCSALLIDLASKPGGVDFDAASALRIKTVHALGLPGKAAPMDAGKYLMERILRAL